MKQASLSALVCTLALGVCLPAHAEKPLKLVGVTVGDLANPFFVAIGKGAEDAAKKIGGTGVKVTTVSSKYDLNTQVGQVENFIANKADIIIVNAADPKALGPVIAKARKAGIVVMAVDVAAEGADATIMSDNAMAGAESCRFISDRLGGKGNVVIVNGPPVSSVIERVAGCKKVLKASGIKILSDNQDAKGSRDGGMEVMANLLAAHPKIDAVFAINDPSAIGAELAVKQSRRSDVKLVASVDGAPDAEVALKDGKSLFAVSTAQNPYKMASMAVEIGYGIMNGKPPASPTILIPTPPVTKANVAEYKGWTRN
ncbi:MAG: ABC transporter substrate-binding protein [Rhodocyclaceae bacterium]|nr:ABC transporter substrate-binding protein [Rhodocyclaceae bacterium]